MNNEPVAWMDKRTNKCVVFINTPPSDDWIPLYTHPVKETLDTRSYLMGRYDTSPVELTNEEIEQVYKETHFSETIGDCDYMDFARAILRKAQEK